MDQQRQKAFQKLRPTCVELSSVALKFKGHQVAVKDVLHALEGQHQVLQELGSQDQLDEKLAEYSFFPLTHVFNESQRLSSSCMQCAVQSVTILVSKGWRLKMAPVMGKQLLILMSLLAGSDPQKQREPPTDELKCAAFDCIRMLIRWLSRSKAGSTILQDQSTRNIVDQLAYLLVDVIAEAISDEVQTTAAEALLELNVTISNRVFLASLLPRTVSSLTRALRPSTQARRTRKVLVTNLNLLGVVLNRVLSDEFTYQVEKEQSEKEALDGSWLKATTSQVKNALAQVCKLRTHDQVGVRKALFDLCIMLMDNCNRTLEESMPLLTETTVVLTGNIDDDTAVSRIERMVSIHPELADILKSSFYDWLQSLPRVMQGNDDRLKSLMISRMINCFNLLTAVLPGDEGIINTLCSAVLRSVAVTIDSDKDKPVQAYEGPSDQSLSLVQLNAVQSKDFQAVLFDHQSQRDLMQILHTLIQRLQQHASVGKITRHIIDSLPGCSFDEKLAPLWLAVLLLRKHPESTLELEDILDLPDDPSEHDTLQASLVQDLYTYTKDILLESSPYSFEPQPDHRIVALALQSVVLQAEQFGPAYHTELCESLYPVIALVSSRDHLLRDHAMTALNMLASSCGYASVSALLIENADYLVNSIAWKLNTFNLSAEAPAVLNIVIRLVGSQVVPYLDDLIASIFSALDSFHGYPQWVEMLFEVLKTMVDESVKNPEIVMTDRVDLASHERVESKTATIDDVLTHLKARKQYKLVSGRPTHIPGLDSAPHRPWTKKQDDPNFRPDPTEGKDIETLLREAETADEQNDLPAPKDPNHEEDPAKPLSKSHDLLLRIAQATVPHLSSPSPRVRHILLQLLGQISPLLARHENTFLPLVNTIWPGVVQRLFTDVAVVTSAADAQSSEGEMAYNVAAAADVVTSLCETAGGFMSQRIEQIMVQLKGLYSKMWKEVESQVARNDKRRAASPVPSSTDDYYNNNNTGKNIRGAVDLQITTKPTSTPLASTTIAIQPDSSSSTSSAALSSSRTSHGQIFSSLTHLLIAILSHVQPRTDIASEIFALLTPLLDYAGAVGRDVTSALEQYNPDAVWVLRVRKKGEGEIMRGERAVQDRVWRSVEKLGFVRKVGERRNVEVRPIVF